MLLYHPFNRNYHIVKYHDYSLIAIVTRVTMAEAKQIKQIGHTLISINHWESDIQMAFVCKIIFIDISFHNKTSIYQFETNTYAMNE